MTRFGVIAGFLAIVPLAQTQSPGEWPTLNGDYSSRRHSPLTQINKSNVGQLTQAWKFRPNAGVIKGTPLMVNGVLYLTVPDHVWAVDAATGRELWHFNRPSRGDRIANRGVAMYKKWIYFGTPDAFLVCLRADTGEKVWEAPMADVHFGYYMSLPPLVVKDKLIVGISGDAADVTGFLKAVDPVTGNVLWTWNSVPKWGEPGSETWPSAEALAHGGAMTWVQGSYDPDLNLIYWGTGNPHPVMNGAERPGANLYTCSIVAINADTGKLVWYFQPSPHDTYDRDATESVVLIDGVFRGRQRKMLAQASRNGYFFLLDRKTGEHLRTTPFGPQNWSLGLNRRGEPIPDPKKDPRPDGTLFLGSGTNWYTPAFNPATGLFYVNAAQGVWSLTYLSAGIEGEPEDHQGGREAPLGGGESSLLAIDYQTGGVRWKLGYGNAAGILTTASGLVFTANSGYLVGLDAENGKTLWKQNAGGPASNAPITYQLGGKQFVVVSVRDTLYAFVLPAKP
ncbi:MAG: glucose dehydrogenase [Bryobacterales bacterium]|nr:glucose dehydrogenase [Bryobacterales bacterium]